MDRYVLDIALRSPYVRSLFVPAVAYVISAVLKVHLSSVLFLILRTGRWYDTATSICIDVGIYYVSSDIYSAVYSRKRHIARMVDSAIDNYRPEKLVIWKRWIVLSVLCYFVVVCSLCKIDNGMILYTVLQNVVTFAVCDVIDNRVLQNVYSKMNQKREAATLYERVAIVEDYSRT